MNEGEVRLVPFDDEPDACEVYVQTGVVIWVFRISRIVPKYSALESFVALEWEPANANQPDVGLPQRKVAPLHVNWRSGSSLDSLERRLRGTYDPKKRLELAFSDILQIVAEKLNEFIFDAGDLRSVEYNENSPRPTYLVHPIWPKSTRPVVWFGQGETMKGTLAVAAAMSACNGVNMATMRTETLSRGIAYVDYEDTYEEFERRVSRYSAGLGILPNGLLRHFDPRGRLFIDVVEQVKGKVKAIGGVDAYIIDSAIPACGGDVNKPEPVGAFFAALASLGKPAIIIAHENKDGNDEFPFGSQLWRTEPSMNVNFQAGADPRQDTDGNWVRDVLLRCTKSNNVPRFKPLAFQAIFTDDESGNGTKNGRPDATWIRQINPTTVSLDLHAKLPPLQRLVAIMKDSGETTVKELSEASQLSYKTTAALLARNLNTFVSEGGGKGKGNAATWRLVS